MKYERRSAVIDAVQINKLADADTVIRDCPHIVGVNDVWVFTEDPEANYIRFEGVDADYQVDFYDYLVWDGDGVKVVSKKKFEKKYRPSYTNNLTISTSTSPGIVSGMGFAKYPG